MDVDIEALTALLCSEGTKGDALKDDEFADYLKHLSSCGIENLVRERIYLKDEKSSLLEQTQTLVSANYKTFIHTADCSRSIYKKFSYVEEHLEELLQNLPALKCKVENFVSSSRNLSSSRHTSSLTLTKHTQLLEMLELPQLMDTCVRNGYYDDALEILSYVRRLERKHSDVPALVSIVSDIKTGNRMMLQQLLSQLRSSVTLPHCLKIVGLLRRLDVFNEQELRLKFLQTRDSWLTGLIKAIPKEDPYHHINNVVEASRVHLFDIVTQYRAIFSDDDVRAGIGEGSDQSVFHGWFIHKISQFLNILEIDLNRGVGLNMESLLAQCMFFGQSFSRIGADFRPLLIPIFQRAIFLQFENDVKGANSKFDATFNSFSLMDIVQLQPSSLFLTEVQDKKNPSLRLIEYPPLAHYMNGLAGAFNTLRQCCPVGLVHKVVRVLEASVAKVIRAIVNVHQLESAGFTANEEKAFQRLSHLTVGVLIPNINSCLRSLFPLQLIANTCGVPVAQLQNTRFAQIEEDITKPLLGFFPKDLISDAPTSSLDASPLEKESKEASVQDKETKELEVPSNENHTEETLNEKQDS